jgi:hypothetical protein
LEAAFSTGGLLLSERLSDFTAADAAGFSAGVCCELAVAACPDLFSLTGAATTAAGSGLGALSVCCA